MVGELEASGRETMNHTVPEVPQVISERAIRRGKAFCNEATKSLTVSAWSRGIWVPIPAQSFNTGKHTDKREKCRFIPNQLRDAPKINPTEPFDHITNLFIHNLIECGS